MSSCTARRCTTSRPHPQQPRTRGRGSCWTAPPAPARASRWRPRSRGRGPAACWCCTCRPRSPSSRTPSSPGAAEVQTHILCGSHLNREPADGACAYVASVHALRATLCPEQALNGHTRSGLACECWYCSASSPLLSVHLGPNDRETSLGGSLRMHNIESAMSLEARRCTGTRAAAGTPRTWRACCCGRCCTITALS